MLLSQQFSVSDKRALPETNLNFFFKPVEQVELYVALRQLKNNKACSNIKDIHPFALEHI